MRGYAVCGVLCEFKFGPSKVVFATWFKYRGAWFYIRSWHDYFSVLIAPLVLYEYRWNTLDSKKRNIWNNLIGKYSMAKENLCNVSFANILETGLMVTVILSCYINSPKMDFDSICVYCVRLLNRKGKNNISVVVVLLINTNVQSQPLN